MVWGALQGSIVLYGALLYVAQRLALLAFPQSVTPIEMAGLVAPSIYVVNLLVFRRRMARARTGQEKFLAHVIFWALNETIVVLGFAASYTNEAGNGFFYLTNAAVALLGNFRAFPNWKTGPVNN